MLSNPLPNTIDLFFIFFIMFLSGGDSRIATRGKRFSPVGANEADS